MPELPEVETIVRALRCGGRNAEPILGRNILEAEVFWAKTIAAPSPEAFREQIQGQEVRSIGRRGKFLILGLTNVTVLVHLRMSGDLRVEAQTEPTQLHDRVHLLFSDGTRLAFNDTRKFGRFWLVADPTEVLADLGMDALDADLTAEKFVAMLAGKQRQLKPLLMDQSFIAGLGNIYTDEALFLAGLHPLSLASAVPVEQAQRLLEAIHSVLEEGIRRNGASIDWVYRGGEFQNYFQVYQRQGQACKRCQTAIERILVGQRSTHFCPSCQPAPAKDPAGCN